MKISKIAVYGLFDRFNHDLVLNPDDKITIMFGPNGIGKTKILEILDILFNRPVWNLGRMPFQAVKVFFDDNSILKVDRKSGGRVPVNGHEHPKLQLEYSLPTGKSEIFVPKVPSDKESSLFPVEDFEPPLRHIGSWLERNILEPDEAIESNQPPIRESRDTSSPTWLAEIKASMQVRFIGVERLTQQSSYTTRSAAPMRRKYDFRFSTQRTIRRYSNNLAQMLQKKLTEYASLSQSLDRTFPVRLVEDTISPALTPEELDRKLVEVEEKRSKFEKAGLLVQEEDLGVSAIRSVDKVDASRQGVLAVYAEDAVKKLSVFDDLYARVNTLTRIANERFLYKQVSVSAEGLQVVDEDGDNLALEILSSGEQHELVLLYGLLFGTSKNSLVMIDEPELSLHVAWQDMLLSDLQEVAQLSDFHILLATHSPQIIGDRWDLTVELKGTH